MQKANQPIFIQRGMVSKKCRNCSMTYGFCALQSSRRAQNKSFFQFAVEVVIPGYRFEADFEVEEAEVLVGRVDGVAV